MDMSPEQQAFARAKEQHGYVALDYEQELSKCVQNADLDRTFELPDGTTVTLGDARFKCGEAIFTPELMGHHVCGAAELVHNAVSQCNYFVRDDLFGNVVLSGGNMVS